MLVILPVLYLSYSTSLWYLLLYPLIQVIIDILYYQFRIAFYDPDLIVQKGYSVSAFFNDTLHSQGLDYGFNFYDGDFEKPREQAQIDKFEYAFEQLGLRAGMRLIDIGCGCGDWLNYLKTEKGIHVAGVNITYEQVAECHGRGLDVYHTNWKDIDGNQELRDKLYGQFDAVSFWDTIEHYVPMQYNSDREKAAEIYTDMFRMASDLIDQESECRRVWTSCLHMRYSVNEMPVSLKKVQKLLEYYLLDKFHSGSYPSDQRDQLASCSVDYFDLIHKRDTTMDYYMTSMLEPTHFGRHKFRFTPGRLLDMISWVILDPCWIQRWIWFYKEGWMVQFNPDDIESSDTIHWWMVFQHK